MAATNGGGTESHAVTQIERNPSHAQNDTTAEVVGKDNGKTAIGTTASDTGGKLASNSAASLAMIQHGLDKFSINMDDGKNLGDAFKNTDDGRKLSDLLKHFNEPTDQERKDAQGKLDGEVSKLLSPEDQKTLGSMQKAVLDGDPKAFGDAIAKFKDNPEKLKAFLDEMNKNLQNSGSDTRAEVDSKGNVILHNGGDTGVVFGPDGKASVHEITHRPDGSVVVGGEVVGGDDAGAVMKRIGDGTVIDMERHQTSGSWPGGIDAPNPINPQVPFPWPDKPIPMPEPDWPQPHQPRPDWPQPDRPYGHGGWSSPPLLDEANRPNFDAYMERLRDMNGQR